MIRTLKDLNAGEKAVVIAIEGTSTQRMMEMGITVGTTLQVRRIAPFGDPREVIVRGYSLLLRNAEAASILIARCQEADTSQ